MKDERMDEAQFLSSIDQEIRNITFSHAKGILSEMAQYHFAVSGKRIRSRAAYTIATSLEVDPSEILGWLVSCELLHNASIVHDDIQDQDDFRRGTLSVWKKYGINHAINLGDLLLVIAPLGIKKLSSPIVREHVMNTYIDMVVRMAAGQSHELILNSVPKGWKIFDEYQYTVGEKTGVLFSAMAKGVCQIGGLSIAESLLVENVFYNIGVLFQWNDDLLDIYGDKGRNKKACDIREGKVSLPIALLLEIDEVEQDSLVSILKKPRQQTTDEDVDFVISLIEKFELKEKCQKMIEEKIDQILIDCEGVQKENFTRSVKSSLEKMLFWTGRDLSRLNNEQYGYIS